MKKAFTLLELVFVIVVVGILAAVIIPKTKTNPVQEAALQLLSHIRYTQHLALIDDKFDANDENWYKQRWQIMFGKNTNSDGKWAYTIFSDTSGESTGDANEIEIAIDPANPNRRMTGGYTGANKLDINHADFVGMNKLNLGRSYGITDISSTCGQRISFDYIGRPMRGDQSTLSGPYMAGTDRLLKTPCVLTLKNSDEQVIITISPESGYAKITF
ncbi:type II secretion system protein [Sulfurimonas sp.]|uniref:type II secretion system protein n=1 Tax=Sulfurimonas sp. TaxID=2022749 RepID=UPI00262C34EF|nr:type II secretion system protein [Sulfurimonas sp.]